MNIAIIPARGGSKRIPRKNARTFCGKPILAYSVRAALESARFDKVMVSTDDEEIAGLAREYGAEVPFFRSRENASDYATTAEVLLEVLAEYEKRGESFSTVCCLYPTAPFVRGERLREAMRLLETENADAVVPVAPFSYPPLRGLVVRNDRLEMRWPEHRNTRSQDLEPIYHDSGQFYLVRAAALLEEKTLFCRNTVPLRLSQLEVQDIDTDADWQLAELKFELLRERGQL